MQFQAPGPRVQTKRVLSLRLPCAWSMTVSGRTSQKHLAIAQSPTRATEESASCDVHEVHNPPSEVDLDEIYYYRFCRPEGYARTRGCIRRTERARQWLPRATATPCWY